MRRPYRFPHPFLARWGPFLLWMGVIFAFSASSDPYRTLPSNWESACLSIHLGSFCQDEMLGRFSHAAEYALLALLACRGVFWQRDLTAGGLPLAAGLAFAYALLDETHQLFVPGRTFQLSDLGLDGLGIVLGLLIFVFIRRLRANRPPAPG